MIITVKNPAYLKDSLYNTSRDVVDSGSPDFARYAQGVVAGELSAIMALTGCSYELACEVVRQYLPEDVAQEAIPSPFQPELLFHKEPVVEENMDENKSKWVIYTTNEMTLDDEPAGILFWNNELGWTNQAEAQVFDTTDLNLPLKGHWMNYENFLSYLDPEDE